MIKISISLMLIISIICPSYMNSTSIAQGEVTSSEELVGDGVNKIDGKYYVPPQSDFMINYTINNGRDINITQIKVNETLIGGS